MITSIGIWSRENKSCQCSRKIALRAHTRHLGRHVEQRMSDLAGHHVDLIVQGNRDDHVGLIGTRQRQCVGMRTMPDETAHIERIADRIDEFG